MGKPAAHEAGHAVAAMMLGHGCRLRAVTVNPEASDAPVLRTAQGATEFRGEPDLRTREGIDSWATVVAAGAAAERLEGAEPDGFDDEDALMALFMARCNFEARFRAWRRRIDGQACRVLVAPEGQRAVAALAGALERRGTIRGARRIRRAAGIK